LVAGHIGCSNAGQCQHHPPATSVALEQARSAVPSSVSAIIARPAEAIQPASTGLTLIGFAIRQRSDHTQTGLADGGRQAAAPMVPPLRCECTGHNVKVRPAAPRPIAISAIVMPVHRSAASNRRS
jgi:hypothetical protein